MKKIIYIWLLSIVFSCDSEHAGNCFQTTGNLVQNKITLAAFDKILVNRDIELIISEGDEQQVTIETGKNLMNDVVAEVVDGQLVLTDNNTCNFVRGYGITKVYVTSPNITQIRSSTQYDIRSEGVLTYPKLTLLSEDFGAPNTFNVGNFRVQVDNESLGVVFNNLSVCYAEGKTNNLNVTLAAGNCRFEGGALEAQHVTIWNRSSNDMVLNPQQSLKGKISGIGNVVSVNRPPVVEVEIIYKGQLIFK